MLHGLTRHSCSRLLNLLRSQLEKAVEVTNIVKDIPEDVEELEKTLQVYAVMRMSSSSCSHSSCILQLCNGVKKYIASGQNTHGIVV